MSIWGRAKTKAEELLGRAEQVYGESHGDAAATLAGEAHVIEAQAEEAEQDARDAASRPDDDAPGSHRPDDDGPVPAR